MQRPDDDNVNRITFDVCPSGRRLWKCRDPYVVYWGPAGTGKTRTWLERINYLCVRYPGIRVLMCRLYRSSMTQSCMKLFEREVLKPEDEVRFSSKNASYLYPYREATSGPFKGQRAQSEIVVCGMDDPEKAMSAQYDLIYWNELTDGTREQWEWLFSRNRNGVMPFQQMGGDANPRQPKHWLKVDMDAGKITSIQARLEENPRYFNSKLGVWTPEGAAYLEKLGHMTGPRRAWLLEGKWVAAEGAIYDTFDRGVHVIPNRPLPPSKTRRHIWTVDFGYVNPFVWQNWVVDADGRMTLVQEIYHTKLLVEDAARMILEAVVGQPYPEAIICDHDQEDRATLERHLGIPTANAWKDVTTGIEACQSRLKIVYDGINLVNGVDMGRPRIQFYHDTLIHEPDAELARVGKPTCTVEEIEGYVWDMKKSEEDQKGSIPVKKNDHGVDAMRYGAAYLDDLAITLVEDELAGFHELADYSEIHSLSGYYF